ncbi:MAG: histidine--tRNA ligase [Minisyncoccia bacterium]
MTENTKLSTESYKGVRDFYPEDQVIQNYIFNVWKKTVRSFGYEEYNASILESSELYKQKSGEEIVNEQTYTFKDRGDREVTLRPEMTPTVARMVAAKERELSFPLRWFSIPNLFRYEKPQKGRLREHWQLNVDLFGISGTNADAEIISVAYRILVKFGAKEDDFVIKINNRKIINSLYKQFDLDEDKSYKLSKIIDKKDKIDSTSFEVAVSEILGERAQEFLRLLEANDRLLSSLGETSEGVKELVTTLEKLDKLGIKNVEFDPYLMRGFDYYTGFVFEVFDTSDENLRSIFGGGRYDDLLDIFEAKKIPSVGFGVGDVTTRDFLETHKLLPNPTPETQVYICTVKNEFVPDATVLADKLRADGVNVEVDISDKKLGDQMKLANKKGIPFTICVGEDEVKSGIYKLKNMISGEEKSLKVEELAKAISNS